MTLLDREEAWGRLGERWDLLVIGGGITGAGILREAARRGLRAALVEQRDFAWGTSSRSSKLVHGGLRYLRHGHFRLTAAAVRERERLRREAADLVMPLSCLFPAYEDDGAQRWLFGLALWAYDALAGRISHRWYDPVAFSALAPRLDRERLQGGFHYEDAQVDDARLVLRVISEACAGGAVALNYAPVERLLRTDGLVCGAVVRDRVSGREAEVQARVVVNATGAWCDGLRDQLGAGHRLRPLRGSHLTFPGWRLPVAQAVTLLHPSDQRPLFVIPWEGVTLVGTTDLDHEAPLDEEPRISPRELDYLMTALQRRFPFLDLGPRDVLATFAGVRPVVGTGKKDPSQESRDHALWQDNGMLTVTGGKLTTFRLIARDALDALRDRLPGREANGSWFTPAPAPPPSVSARRATIRRLLGRYGPEVAPLLAAAEATELDEVPGTTAAWAELRHAARAEAVVHLDDLLLRRVRLGLLLPDGATGVLPRVRAICQPVLGWDDARWVQEERAYRDLWRAHYSLP